jgi:hypothetical protein
MMIARKAALKGFNSSPLLAIVSGTILSSLCDQDAVGFLKESATCLPYF